MCAYMTDSHEPDPTVAVTPLPAEALQRYAASLVEIADGLKLIDVEDEQSLKEADELREAALAIVNILDARFSQMWIGQPPLQDGKTRITGVQRPARGGKALHVPPSGYMPHLTPRRPG